MKQRITVFGEESQVVADDLEKAGFAITSHKPDVVFCHGGDGTLLRAERIWPGVAKVPLRLPRHVKSCPAHSRDAVIHRLVSGQLERSRVPKLEVNLGAQQFMALNEVILRNPVPTVAVRFRVYCPGMLDKERTGDGVVIAGRFGSTGYFKSVSGRSLSGGLGVALINPTVPEDLALCSEEVSVKVVLTRGRAVMTRDNDPRAVTLRSGMSFSVALGEGHAEVLGLDALACQECRRHDGEPFNPH